jgi:ribosomal protein S21
MLIVKVDKNSNIEKALKEYKGKIIKTRQISKLNERKEFIKISVKKRNVLNNAKYVQKNYKNKSN